MPRASPPNDTTVPLSARPHPCLDNDDSQTHSQPQHYYPTPPLVPTITAPTTTDDTERPVLAVLAPESQPEVNHNVDMNHGPERMRDVRRDADEAHKQRTETGNEASGAARGSAHAVHVEQVNRNIEPTRLARAPTLSAALSEARQAAITSTSTTRPISTHKLVRSRKQDDEFVAPSATTLGQVEEVDATDHDAGWVNDYGLAGLSYEYCQTRVTPSTPSSYLRPGSKFSGMQKSERSRYDVEVEIKHVDLRESFLCGYLRIQGT